MKMSGNGLGPGGGGAYWRGRVFSNKTKMMMMSWGLSASSTALLSTNKA